MAYSIRNPTLALAVFTALTAAAPQGHGHWKSRPAWGQPPPSVVTTVVVPVTETSPPIVPSSVVPVVSSVVPVVSSVAPVTPVVPVSTVVATVPNTVPTGGGISTAVVSAASSAAQGSATQVIPSGTATGAQPTGTGSTGGGGSHCTGEACRPGGKKAGCAGADAVALLGDAVSWFYDWSPNPSVPGSNAIAVPMLWGDGKANSVDAERFAAFSSISQPDWILGFNEPDIGGDNSANMNVSVATQVWNDDFVPKIGANTKVGSPAPANQDGSTWLTDFANSGLKADWDITAIHVYKDNADDAKTVIDSFASLFPDKAIWVTEWACVDTSSGFVGCTDQDTITGFIGDMVKMLEAHPNVQGYSAITAGYGLSDAWNFVGSDGQLSTSGQAYLAAIGGGS